VSTPDLDPAAIMVAHTGHAEGCKARFEYAYSYEPSCETYRLAAEVRRLRNSPMWARYSDQADEIVRLREVTHAWAESMQDADAERDRLAAENAALREQVQRVRDLAESWTIHYTGDRGATTGTPTLAALELAAALDGDQPTGEPA
jgi:hypothetical protein